MRAKQAFYSHFLYTSQPLGRIKNTKTWHVARSCLDITHKGDGWNYSVSIKSLLNLSSVFVPAAVIFLYPSWLHIMRCWSVITHTTTYLFRAMLPSMKHDLVGKMHWSQLYSLIYSSFSRPCEFELLKRSCKHEAASQGKSLGDELAVV